MHAGKGCLVEEIQKKAMESQYLKLLIELCI